MRINYNDGALVVRQMPELDAANGDALAREIDTCLSPELRRVEFDLSDTEFMDCTGAGRLLSVASKIHRICPRARVTVLNPGPRVRRLFVLTGMDAVLPAERSLEQQCKPGLAPPGEVLASKGAVQVAIPCVIT